MIALSFRPVAQKLLSVPARRELARRTRRMVRAAGLADPSLGPDVEVGLTITDDAEIHALNRSYRRKDKPTENDRVQQVG